MFSSNTSQVSNAATYIEDVFSTYVWPTTASPNTVVNGIDLATYGGMNWTKLRNSADNNRIWDSARGPTKRLITDSTAAQVDEGIYGEIFNTNGFTDRWFGSGYNAVSWTFRKQPKFFDVVTYTGTGSATTIAHNLGSVPGCIIVKQTSGTENWRVYHVSTGNGQSLYLNTTDQALSTSVWNSTTPTSTAFSVSGSPAVNGSGSTYVAYLFASDAGGFGLTGTDNVISCGSFDGTANTTVTLGYEPQWIMFKNTTSASNWQIVDNMRAMPVGSADKQLMANLSNAESDNSLMTPTATGFTWLPSAAGNTYIYIAIRRGPMKVPTSGTSVFSPVTYTGDNTSARDFTNFGMLPDFVMLKQRNGTEPNHVIDRLRSGGNYLVSSATQAESAYPVLNFDSMNGVNDLDSYFNASGATWVFEAFRRAPNFFDEVCYTGTGANATWTHNLGAVPEMMIVKKRGGVANWAVYHSELGAAGYALLNTTAASSSSSTFWQSTTPTSTSFYTGTNGNVGDSGLTYVAYLFATCAGVSKVGSYTGTGATQTISCGFTGGARFVLIKRTDSTGDWYVWDTARGMVAGTDPSLLLNSTAAEVNANSIYTTTGGFQIVSTAAGINASGGTYIYLAIA